MKALILGDIHLNNSPFLWKRVQEIIKLNKKLKFNTLIQLGDLFDNYMLSNTDLLYFSAFIKALTYAGFKHIYIVQGNHEIPKYSNIPAIAKIINNLYLNIKYISKSTIIENIQFIPYTNEMININESCDVILSHIDTALLNKIHNKICINGHNHTHSQYAQNKYDLGSVIPMEFDQNYSGYNYYCILNNAKILIKKFKYEIKQKIITIKSYKDLENVKKQNNEQLKIILDTKEIRSSELKKLIKDNIVDRFEIKSKSKTVFQDDIQKLLSTIVDNKNIMLENNIQKNIIEQAEIQLQNLIGI